MLIDRLTQWLRSFCLSLLIMLQSSFFHPWVGSNYNKHGFRNKKILVLGESHYCGEGCDTCGLISETKCNNFTSRVVEEYLAYKRGNAKHKHWMNTFTRFANVLNGEQLELDNSLNFWNSILFYNYIQKALDGPRMPPTETDFKNSEVAFIELLEKHKPDLIIVWGERLWNRLPSGGYWGNQVLDSNDKLYYYKISTKDIPAYSIYHPSSSAFSYD